MRALDMLTFEIALCNALQITIYLILVHICVYPQCSKLQKSAILGSHNCLPQRLKSMFLEKMLIFSTFVITLQIFPFLKHCDMRHTLYQKISTITYLNLRQIITNHSLALQVTLSMYLGRNICFTFASLNLLNENSS